FSFGWGHIEGDLQAGPARLALSINKAGEAWRQVDAILLTDDLAFTPAGREKPRFAYERSFSLHAKDGPSWRGSGKGLTPGASWKRPAVGGRDFAMWTSADSDPKWWAKQNIGTLTLHDVLFQFAPPADIRDKFHKDFAGRKDIP